MSRVALLTFHASHNFGSVLQAYCLKRSIEDLGNLCDIINFRPPSQIDKYSFLPRQYGIRAMLQRMPSLLHLTDVKNSHKKYEDFIKDRLVSSPSFGRMDDFESLPTYSVYVTGSDQVWGYSIPEFVRSKEDIRPAYYLAFATGRKVSYASSTGEASLEQLKPYASYLSEYSAISVREEQSRTLIERLSGKPVECCLDPTFLLDESDYQNLLMETKSARRDDTYVLLYSLQGRRSNKDWLAFAESVSKSTGLPIVSVSPFWERRSQFVRPMRDAGPLDILSLFAGANLVITDTFHGTLFSTHFNKQFVTFEPDRDDLRMRSILDSLGISERVVHNIEDGVSALSSFIDYDQVSVKRNELVEQSVDYLRKAIGG